MDDIISYKSIWRIALPIIISGIAQNIVNVTDTIFLGRVSEVALGAAGNAGIFYFILVITGIGFSTGSQIIIGRRNGEKNYHQIGRVVDHSFYFMLPLALILFLFTQYISPALLEPVTLSTNIFNASKEFLDYRSYGIFFAFLNFIFIAFYVGITQTRVLVYTTIIMSVVNVFLDYALIFGHFGFPEMGIKGAAIASVISEATAFLFFVIHLFLKVDRNKFDLFRFQKIDSNILKRLLKIGTPVMFQSFLALTSWFIFFMIIEKMGERNLAISHIIRSIYMVLMIPLLGFNSVANTLVSNLIGEGKSNIVLKAIKRLIIMSFISTFILVSFNLFIPETIIGFYTNDVSLIKETIKTLNVISISIFFFCFASILFNGVTGTGNTITSLIIEVITISIYISLTYYIAIVLNSTLSMVWASEFIYFTLLGVLSFLYLKRGNWSKKTV